MKKILFTINRNMPRKVWSLLIIFFIVRMALSLLFPLTADESYYWLWSKHISLSYVDHPPMVAYINFLFTFGKEFLFGIRFGANLLFLIASALLYLIAKKTTNEKVAFQSLIIFNLIPHYLIIWLTQFVEIPLAVFWLLSILILTMIVQDKNEKLWYLLGITLGLGYLSKYTMFLFWPCLLIFFWLSKENRYWFKKKELYFGIIISAVFFLPVILWNWQHDWISFTYHSTKATTDATGTNFLAFIADQLIHFTPFIIFTMFNANRYCLKKDDNTKLLFSFSVPILLFFLLISLKVKVWAHWPAIGYILTIPNIVLYLTETKKSLGKFISWITVFSLLVLGILFWLSPGILLNQQNYQKNTELKILIPKDIKVYTQNYASASLLEFYLKKTTYLATGFMKVGQSWGTAQYKLWGIPDLKSGEDIIFFGEDSETTHDIAKQQFKKVEILPHKLYLIEDYMTNNFVFMKLSGYRGTSNHP